MKMAKKKKKRVKISNVDYSQECGNCKEWDEAGGDTQYCKIKKRLVMDWFWCKQWEKK